MCFFSGDGFTDNRGGSSVDAQKGPGKMVEQMKSQENIIIESFINECMRESMRNHNNNKNNKNGEVDGIENGKKSNGDVKNKREGSGSDNRNSNYNHDNDRGEEEQSSFVVAKETKHVGRSGYTLQNGYNSTDKNKTAPAKTTTNKSKNNSKKCEDISSPEKSNYREQPVPRRGHSDAQLHQASNRNNNNATKSNKAAPPRRPRSNISDISDITERQKRASQRISSYYEKSSTNTSMENVAGARRNGVRTGGKKKQNTSFSSSKNELQNDSEHGSTLSAFALVPGTDLQRKLSQHGINDKASIDIIKQTTTMKGGAGGSQGRNKYHPPSSQAAGRIKRRSFHSVDNIYASSSMSQQQNNARKNRLSANNMGPPSMMTSNLHSSFSADDIVDETGKHMFKPLKGENIIDSDGATGNNSAGGGGKDPAILNFMITSTPREVDDVPEEHEGDDEYATYV